MPTNSLHTAPSAAELDELRELARRAGVPIPSKNLPALANIVADFQAAGLKFNTEATT